MRTWALLRALAEEGHAVTMAVFATRDEVDPVLAEASTVLKQVELVEPVAANLSQGGAYLRRAAGVLSSLPYSVNRFRSAQMRNLVEQHLASGDYDAVVCDTVYSAVNLPEPLPVPLVLNNVDVEHLILQRYLPFERNPLKRAYAGLEARKVRAWEQSTCRRAAVGMACSEHDRKTLQALAADLPMTVVPNIVDVASFQIADDPGTNTVLYQGGMDWFPNRDAVQFFVAEILPELRRRVPGVRFIAAGRNPSPEFRARFAGMPDVEFTGTVPDMRPIIRDAAVCVVPLRIGSGTRLKILEAAAMGKPVVSTSLGAEGLDFRDGESILIADSPALFAARVEQLLTVPSLRRSLGCSARRVSEMKYTPECVRRSVAEALAYVVAPDRERSAPAGADALR